MRRRASGVLLHVSSLPSAYGIGDFGPQAEGMVEFLSDSLQSYWQILPLNPTDPSHGNSPYESSSAFALDPLFVSPELLYRDGLIDRSDLDSVPRFPRREVDFPRVHVFKKDLLQKAVESLGPAAESPTFADFRDEHGLWLDDYALYVTLARSFGPDWSAWPEEYRDRHPDSLQSVRRERAPQILRVELEQFLLFRQWTAVRRSANRAGVHIIGDMPIYVHFESSDVWAHRELFELDPEGRPLVVAGVPPDDFSETGQLWGNPIYRWDVMEASGFGWWLDRFRHNLALYDAVRIDHFRGLVAFWQVPASETTAVAGRWVTAPTRGLLDRMTRIDPWLPVIAEDLGRITPDVREVIRSYGLPGMRVLLFAFQKDPGTNPYLPHNIPENSVVYTGTHDNNTVRGWFEREADRLTIERIRRYAGHRVGARNAAEVFVRFALMSAANTAIIPLQDIMNLGEEARMNVPARSEGNWRWRYAGSALTERHRDSLRELTEAYGRGSA